MQIDNVKMQKLYNCRVRIKQLKKDSKIIPINKKHINNNIWRLNSVRETIKRLQEEDLKCIAVVGIENNEDGDCFFAYSVMNMQEKTFLHTLLFKNMILDELDGSD